MTGMYGNAHENMRRAQQQRVSVNMQTGQPTNQNQDQNQDQDQQPTFPKVEKATLVLPDGTAVLADEADYFAEKRREIEKDEARIKGMKEVLDGQLLNQEVDPNAQNAGSDEEPKEEDPFASITGVEINDDEYTSENEKRLAQHVNTLTDVVKTIATSSAEDRKKITEGLDSVARSINERAVTEDLQRIEAQTGITEEEILAASRETGIRDVNVLAKVIMGTKAQEAAIKEAEDKANQQRSEAAGGVSGTSQNNGSDQQPQNYFERPEVDFDNNEEVLKHYRIGNTGPPSVSMY